MTYSQAERPHFSEGQYLSAADLTAIVEYARIHRARHDLGAHTWGIAAGLELKEQVVANGQIDLYILPGYAWDGFGRPIIVLAPYRLPVELFESILYDPANDNNSPPGRLFEVWLRYDEAQLNGERLSFEVCDPCVLSPRVQETFRVEIGQRLAVAERQDLLTVGGYSVHARNTPQQFDLPALARELGDESVAFQQLPAAGEHRRWLIPLGLVRWLPYDPSCRSGCQFVQRNDVDIQVSRSLRRYIGVVAGAVHAADKNIRLRDRTKAYSRVESDDLVWAEGSLRVDGDLRLFGSKLEWRDANGQDRGVPFDIRRTNNALQVAIGTASDEHNRFAIGPLKTGATAQTPAYVDEKLVVLANGNVGIGTKNPTEALDVRGPIKLGPNGSLFALGSQQNLRMVVGQVNEDGTPAGGDGFNATYSNEPNSYEVTFEVAFSGKPVVVATAVNAANNDSVVTIRGIESTGFQVTVVAVAAEKVGRSLKSRFTFIALGTP